MHEMALAESVVQIVEAQARAAGSDKVLSVRLEIGALSHVAPEALSFCFDAVTAGGIAAGARLEIDRIPGRGWCHDCSTEVEIDQLGAACPQCGGYRLQVSGGQDLRVKEMEVA
ncbi:MAG: hydrogenase maturation nickel metallochaperone HypA [Paracoccaceae bacterium]